MVERTLYPLLPVIGPRHGASVGAIMAATRSGAWELNDDGTASVGGVTLQPDEFQLTARARAGHEVAEDGDVLVALDTEIDDELATEGLAREVAHRLQALRKRAGYEISDRVRVAIGTDPATAERLGAHRAWLADELLADVVELGDGAEISSADASEAADLDGVAVRALGRSRLRRRRRLEWGRGGRRGTRCVAGGRARACGHGARALRG